MSQVEDMLRRARGGLTAAEQISLYPTISRCPLLTSSSVSQSDRLRLQYNLQYDTALAYISEGYARGFAHFIHYAEQLLVRVQGVAGAANTDGEPAQQVEGGKEGRVSSALAAAWHWLPPA